MTIRVRCECGKNLNAPDEYAGKRAKCPGCGRHLVVPESPTPEYDVFISHSHHDKAIADAMCAAMEGHRLRCWVAPRDILPGKEWSEAIIEGIDACRVMVLIFSSNADQSRQVRREVERAVSKGAIVIPFRVEEVPMSKAMEYFLSSAHWLDAMTDPLDQHLQKLADTVRRLLHKPDASDSRSNSATAPARSAARAKTPASSFAAAVADENLRPVVEDDFRGAFDWGTFGGTAPAHFDAQGYVYEVTPAAGPTASSKIVQETTILTPPFAVEVAVAKLSGPDTNGFGIGLVDGNSTAAPDARPYWSFELAGSGHAGCFEWLNGDAVPLTSRPVDFFLSSHVNLGSAVNRIGVLCRKQGFRVFVNDAWLYDCPRPNLPSAFKLAIRSGALTKLRFQGLKIYRHSQASPSHDGSASAVSRTDGWDEALKAGGYVLQFEDDLQGGRLSWPQAETGYILRTEPAGYRVENLSDGALQIRQDSVLLQRPLAVEVEMTKVAGNDTFGYGFSLCDAQSQAFWGFQIGGTGHAGIFEWRNGDGVPSANPLPFFFTTHLHRGDATNRLGLILDDDRYAIYLNGRWASDGRLENLPAAFKFALRGGRLNVVYNRIRIYRHGPT